MKKIFLILASLATLVACSKELAVKDSVKGEDVFSFVVNDYDGAAPDNKSKYYSNNKSIGDVNIWVYDKNGKLSNKGIDDKGAAFDYTYYGKITSVSAKEIFTNLDDTYDVYIFSNTGKKLDAPTTVGAAKTFGYTYPSYDTFEDYGFPMCCVREDLCPATATDKSFHLTRLVARYNVHFQLKTDKYEFVFTPDSYAKVINSASYIQPFAVESKGVDPEEDFIQGHTDELDLTKLTSADGTELYMLENVQGNVLTDPENRCASNLVKPIYAGITTYIEFTGKLKIYGGTGYEKVTCRYYFGKGTYCGVKRNTTTDLSLIITDKMLERDEWNVVVDDEFNTGSVAFNPSNLSIAGDDTFYEFDAVTDSGEAVGDEAVKFRVSYNSSDYSAAQLTLQYRKKGSSDAWKDYTIGTELEGSQTFRVKSTYTGSEEKTVKFDALLGAEIVSNLSLIVSNYNVHFEIWHIYEYEEDDTDGYHTICTENEYLILRETNGLYKEPDFETTVESLCEQGYCFFNFDKPTYWHIPDIYYVPSLSFEISGITPPVINNLNQWYNSNNEIWSNTHLKGKTISFTCGDGKKRSFQINDLAYKFIRLSSFDVRYVEVYSY